MADAKVEVLTPRNSRIIFIDHQPQMAFGVQSINRQVLKNNTVALAKAAKVFKASPAIHIPDCSTCFRTRSCSSAPREQDHRGMKHRIGPMLGFKWFRTAAITIAGVELLHRIHKSQFDLRALRLKDRTTPVVWKEGLAA
jgi:transposase-like protein